MGCVCVRARTHTCMCERLGERNFSLSLFLGLGAPVDKGQSLVVVRVRGE